MTSSADADPEDITMKNTIIKDMKVTRELNMEDLVNVAGGVIIYISQESGADYRPYVADIAKCLKERNYTREDAVSFIYDTYNSLNMTLIDLEYFLSPDLWDSL